MNLTVNVLYGSTKGFNIDNPWEFSMLELAQQSLHYPNQGAIFYAATTKWPQTNTANIELARLILKRESKINLEMGY